MSTSQSNQAHGSQEVLALHLLHAASQYERVITILSFQYMIYPQNQPYKRILVEQRANLNPREEQVGVKAVHPNQTELPIPVNEIVDSTNIKASVDVSSSAVEQEKGQLAEQGPPMVKHDSEVTVNDHKTAMGGNQSHMYRPLTSDQSQVSCMIRLPKATLYSSLYAYYMSRTKEHCKRCVKLAETRREDVNATQVRFYCDTGMKSVLRLLRRLLITELGYESQHEFRTCVTSNKILFQRKVCEWFSVKVLTVDRASFEEEDCYAIVDLFLALRDEMSVSSSVPNGCKRKVKAQDKAKASTKGTQDLKAKKSPEIPLSDGPDALALKDSKGPSKWDSCFTSFNKKFFEHLRGNPLVEPFSEHLWAHLSIPLLDGVAEPVRPCRALSFDALMKMFAGK